MNAIRSTIQDLFAEAKALAHATMSQPMSERQYLVNVGKYQALLAQASGLKKKFLDPEAHAAAAEIDLPDDEDDTVVPPRRARLDEARRRHVPRSL